MKKNGQGIGGNLFAKLRPGLVSVSFRKLTPPEIVDLCRCAGLEGVEWGGDVHVPHGDSLRGREVALLTREAGLQVAAYGSYYKMGQSEAEGLPFARVLETALALGAPLIRVWAGTRGSADCDPRQRAQIVDDGKRIATLAAAHGVTVACEYHAKTLTDTAASALALLQATAASSLHCYWQPPLGWDEGQQMESLREIHPYLAHLHVYHWADRERRPLAEGAATWAPLLRIARPERAAADRWALLEFVRGDDPAQLIADAATLRQWLATANDS